MWDLIRNSWMMFKTAFFKGKLIGLEGKQKEFVKNPLKIFSEGGDYESGKDTNHQNRFKKT